MLGIIRTVKPDRVSLAAARAHNGESIVGLGASDEEAGGGFGERDVDDFAVLGRDGVRCVRSGRGKC